jgi:D-methionine transport system substrate-binding protein
MIFSSRTFKSAFLLGSALLLAACSDSGNSETRVYKIGLNGTDHEAWDKANELLAEDNIHLEYVSFSDYVKPNEALEEGEIDLNAFQTEIYFHNFNEERGYTDLGILAYTQVAPMGIYSDKYETLEEIEGDLTVAIPNDVTNGGRALKLLEKYGYITVDPDAGITPNIADITSYNDNIEIVEMTATQIPTSLPDLSFAVINNGVAYEAGLTLAEDAIVYEDWQDEGMQNYWNIIAAKKDRLEEEDFIKIKEAYNSDAVKAVVLELYGGQSIPVWD